MFICIESRKKEKKINTSKKSKNLKYKFGVSKGASPLVVARKGWGFGLDYNVSQGGLIKAKQEFSLKILVDKKIIGCNFFIWGFPSPK